MHGVGWLLAVSICCTACSHVVQGLQPDAGDAAFRLPRTSPSPCCSLLHTPQRQPVDVTAADQQAAVSALLGRLLPADAAATFELRIACHKSDSYAQGCDGSFTVQRHEDSVLVAGGSGVDLAAGAYWFLKHRCGAAMKCRFRVILCRQQ